jgi:hypothetical protein
LIHNKFLGRYAKNWIFHQNNILQYFFSKSVHGYLTLSLAAIKKSIEWRLQVQIAFLTEVDLAPSRPE